MEALHLGACPPMQDTQGRWLIVPSEGPAPIKGKHVPLNLCSDTCLDLAPNIHRGCCVELLTFPCCLLGAASLHTQGADQKDKALKFNWVCHSGSGVLSERTQRGDHGPNPPNQYSLSRRPLRLPWGRPSPCLPNEINCEVTWSQEKNDPQPRKMQSFKETQRAQHW